MPCKCLPLSFAYSTIPFWNVLHLLKPCSAQAQFPAGSISSMTVVSLEWLSLSLGASVRLPYVFVSQSHASSWDENLVSLLAYLS